ncbi:MAG: hypothetical protein WAR83_10630 [Flavobacteriales bacterium]|jgi:hypothetical protein
MSMRLVSFIVTTMWQSWCIAQLPVNLELHCANCVASVTLQPPDSVEQILTVPSPLTGPWLQVLSLRAGTGIVIEVNSNETSVELNWVEIRVLCEDPLHKLEIFVDGSNRAKLVTAVP